MPNSTETARSDTDVLVDTPGPLHPPAGAVRFTTDDVEDVRVFASQFDGSHFRQALDSGPLRYECVTLAGRALLFGWVRKGLRLSVHGRAASNYLQLPLVGELRHAWGRTRLGIGPGEAAFVAAGQYTRVQTTPGFILAVRIPASLLDREIERCFPDDAPGWKLQSCKIGTHARGLKSLRTVLGEAVRLASLSVDEASQTALDEVEAAVVARLVNVLADVGGLRRVSVLTEARARQLEVWIEQNLHEPITLARLSAVSGVGARSLQKSFRSLRGLSPTQYILQRRLELARLRLCSCRSGSDVTGVAMECGFTHMGRFSVAYRQRFGESPSTTLRR